MRLPFKFMTGAAVAMLLGLGLCGVDALLPSSRGQEFGGNLAGLGFFMFVFAFLALCITVVWAVVDAVVSSRQGKP